jgi:hypothetical protein
MIAHHCLLAEKRVTTPSHLSRKHFYISSICWHAFISYMWVCYCTAKPLNTGWTYETRCISRQVLHTFVSSYSWPNIDSGLGLQSGSFGLLWAGLSTGHYFTRFQPQAKIAVLYSLISIQQHVVPE